MNFENYVLEEMARSHTEKRQINDLQLEIAELTEANHRFKAKCRDLQAENSNLNSEITSLQHCLIQFSNKDDYYNTCLGNVKCRFDALVDIVKKSSNRHANLLENYKAILDKVSNYDEEMIRKCQAFNKLSITVKKLKNTLSQTRKEVQVKDQEVARLTEELSAALATSEKLMGEKNNAVKQIESLQNEVNSIQVKLHESQTENTALTERNLALENDLKKANETRDNLIAHTNILTNQLRAMDNENRKRQTKRGNDGALYSKEGDIKRMYMPPKKPEQKVFTTPPAKQPLAVKQDNNASQSARNDVDFLERFLSVGLDRVVEPKPRDIKFAQTSEEDDTLDQYKP